MKATTLIFIVLVAIGIWFLYDYMSKANKAAVANLSNPGPLGIGIDPNFTGVTTKPAAVTGTSAPVSVPMTRPITQTDAMKVCFSQQVQDLVDEYNDIPMSFFPNVRKRSIEQQLQSMCPSSIQLLRN